MKKLFTLLMILSLGLVACERTDNDEEKQQPDASVMPEALVDTWTVYQMTMAIGSMEMIVPAELLGEPYTYSFYDDGMAILSILDEEENPNAVMSGRCSDFSEGTMRMYVSAEDFSFDCLYEQLDDDHIVLTLNNNEVGQDDESDGSWVVSYYRFALIRGRHIGITYAEAATAEQLAESEIPEPAATDPLAGTEWNCVAIGFCFNNGEEERMILDGSSAGISMSFDNEGGCSMTMTDSGSWQTVNDTYTYDPATGCITFSQPEMLGDGPVRVVRRGEKLRLIVPESEEETLVLYFEQLK